MVTEKLIQEEMTVHSSLEVHKQLSTSENTKTTYTQSSKINLERKDGGVWLVDVMAESLVQEKYCAFLP